MKPKFYMLVGIPGSGKSTMAKEIDAQVFSSDKLREELWGNESTQGDNEVLFTELHKRIKDCLREGKDCIFDATNIKANKRIQFLKDIQGIECEKICIISITDIELCLQRNQKRQRSVPKEVIIRMYKQFEVPQYREGWNKIVIKRTRKEDKEYDVYSLMDKLKTLNHDNPHHLLTIGDHCCGVAKYIIDNYLLKFIGNERRVMVLMDAAFHHDIGKEFTKSFINGKGEKTEIAHYYNHENVSAYMYLLYMPEFQLETENISTALYVADLIQLHMRMHCHGGNKEKSQEKLKKLVGKLEFEDLCVLNEADTICG